MSGRARHSVRAGFNADDNPFFLRMLTARTE
jgi:hypothetical protein